MKSRLFLLNKRMSPERNEMKRSVSDSTSYLPLYNPLNVLNPLSSISSKI